MLDLSYSPHDLCQTIFLPLNCDGSVASQTDNYTLNGALSGGETAVVVNETIDLDTTPAYGEITLDAAGVPEVVGYGSITAPSTFNLITGTTVTGPHADSDTADVERSTPLVHCAATQVRTIPLVTAEVIDEDPSGQANQNVAFRRIPPQANGYRFEADLSSRENPALWALTNQYSPILDPAEENQIIGFEEVVSSADTCPTCGVASSVCSTMAVIAIYNAWCGNDRHPTYPYVANVFRDLEFEPTTENLVRGRGFNAGRILRATAKQNTLFADPWGIDPRGAGVTASWSEILISQTRIDADADLNALLTSGCGCSACQNPTLAWPTP